MLVLWNRVFDANGFLAQVTATGAKVLAGSAVTAAPRPWPVSTTAPTCR
ncbi:hypothetical protein [Streptomyces eurythermus]